jgi:hypothetical protein
MSPAGVLLMVFGLIFMALLGAGLMALMFYSSRSGHDARVDHDIRGNAAESKEQDRHEA